MAENGKKLITKDVKSTNSRNFVIVEQPRYKATSKKKKGKPLKVKLAGGFNYVVYYLETPGVMDDDIVFQDYFLTLEEAKEKYPNVAVVKWEDVPK
jgi:hypothetical protein